MIMRSCALAGAAICALGGSFGVAVADSSDIPGRPPVTVEADRVTVETEPGTTVQVADDEPEGTVPVVMPPADDDADDDEGLLDDEGVFELRASNKTIEGIYISKTEFLRNEDVDRRLGLLLTEDRDIVGTYGLLVPGMLDDLVPGPFDLSVGMTGFLGLLDDDDDAFAVGPTARLAFALPFETPMAVIGGVTYAPDILTIGDADNVLDVDARYEVQLLPRLVGFAGLHLLRFELDDGGDDEIASNLQVGARFAF